MNIIYKKIDEIHPYEKNPRKNDKAVDDVTNSIKEFGFKVPIIIDKDNIIVAGHTRYKASKKLKLKEVPCIVADDLSDEEIKAFRLADNKVAEKAEWDFDLLEEELDEILDIDMSDFGFEIEKEENIEVQEDDTYTNKIDIPQYQITGEKPEISELVKIDKTNELIEEIKNSNISDEEKDFLLKASTRHYAFNYKNIAEYYTNANKEMQELMEKSALVIIDYNDAIKNGYANLSKEIEQMSEEDYDE